MQGLRMLALPMIPRRLSVSMAIFFSGLAAMPFASRLNSYASRQKTGTVERAGRFRPTGDASQMEVAQPAALSKAVG